MQTRVQGQYLKQLRLKAKKTQPDVAKELGLQSAQFISNMERGLAAVPKIYIKRLMEYLNGDVEVLIKIMADDYELHLCEFVDAPPTIIRKHSEIECSI